VRALRATGASISDLERHRERGLLQQSYDEVGYNYRLTDIQAAVGLVQLGRLPEMLRLRREQAARYTAALQELPEVQPPRVPPHVEPCWSSYCVKLRPGSRRTVEELLRHMAERGISCRRGIPPLYKEPYFAARWPGLRLPASEDVERTTMFLPIFPGLTPAQQDAVVAALAAGLR
jgi:perosamine synthetase